jgi:type VI protein secretion system component VasA
MLTWMAVHARLQINTCLFEEQGQPPAPVLFLWFNAPSSQFDLTSQLKRNYLALATVPSMVAVFTMDGRVLHQNSKSAAAAVRLTSISAPRCLIVKSRSVAGSLSSCHACGTC